MGFFRRKKDAQAMGESERLRRAEEAERSALQHLKGGRLRPAEIDLRKSIELNPTTPTSHGHLGTVLYLLGQLDESAHEFQQAINLDPTDEALRRSHGTVLEAQGREEEALEAYGAAASLNPDNPLAHAAMGSLLLKRGELASAENHVQRALRAEARDPQALMDLAAIRRQRGNAQGAIDALRRAAALLADTAHPPHARTGAVILGQGAGTDRAVLAQCNAKLGLLLEDHGDIQAAAVPLRQALEAAPADAALVFALARVLMKLGRAGEAAQVYERSMRSEPANRDRLEADLARLNAEFGAAATPAIPTKAAPSTLRAPSVETVEAPAVVPDVQPAAPHPIGRARRDAQGQAGSPSEAIVQLEAALRDDPNNSRLHRDLSIEYLRAGRTREAKEQARAAEKLRAQRSSS